MPSATPDNQGPGATAAWYLAARRVALVATVFSSIVFVLLIANAIASRRLDPVKPVRLDAMQIELNKDRNNARLRAEIQHLDREIRTSYLRGRAFASSGLYLLLGGIVVFLLSVEAANKLRRAMPAPRPAAPKEFWLGVAAANRPVIGLGTALGGLLLVLVVLSRHDAGAEYARAAMRPNEGTATSGERRAVEPAGRPMSMTSPSQGASSFAPLVGGAQPAASGLSSASAPSPGAASAPMAPLSTVPIRGPGAASAPAPALTARRVPPPTAVRGGMLSGPAHPDAWGGNWTHFRGPGGTGVGAGEAPVEWDAPAGKGILWKADVPLPGWNSPVVWGKRVFLTGGDKGRREVYCFDANVGTLLWHKAVPLPKPAPEVKIGQDTGYAPSTVSTDGRHVCAAFPTGDVACFDFNGKLLWQRSLGTPENSYGHASSLTIYANGLIVQRDQGRAEDGKSALLALNVDTGETIWQVKRPVSASWSTPIVVHVGDRDQLVTCADPWVIAYDPRTGSEIWRATGLRGDVVPSAVSAAGLVIAGVSGADLLAIRPDSTGDITKTAIAWKYPDDLPDIASPATDGERIYLAASDGYVTCLDAKTGRKLWSQDLRTQFHASPVVAAGRVYLVDSGGVTFVMEAGPAYKLLGKSPVGEPVEATPAVAGGRIYLRGKQRLYCIGAR